MQKGFRWLTQSKVFKPWGQVKVWERNKTWKTGIIVLYTSSDLKRQKPCTILTLQISDLGFACYFEQPQVVQWLCFIVMAHQHTRLPTITNALSPILWIPHYPKLNTPSTYLLYYKKNHLLVCFSNIQLLIAISIYLLDFPCSSVHPLLSHFRICSFINNFLIKF